MFWQKIARSTIDRGDRKPARRRAVRVSTLAAALAVAYSGAAAQDQDATAQRPLFRSAVDLVTLHVTVTDRKGKYLTDVEPREFLVLENGRPQQLSLFQKGGLPLAVAVLFDTSSSVRHAFSDVQDAAARFLRQLRPGDKAAVLAFGDSVKVLQDFTKDRAALENAVNRAKAHGGTALYDAVYIALKELQKVAQVRDAAGPMRQVAVVLSDGEDTASLVGFEDLTALATASNVAVYAIRTGRPSSTPPQYGGADFVLGELARQTGGRSFHSPNPYDLRRVYEDIRMELAQQYAVGYVSNDARKDGRLRRVYVQVTRADAQARTRRSYMAPGPSRAFRR